MLFNVEVSWKNLTISFMNSMEQKMFVRQKTVFSAGALQYVSENQIWKANEESIDEFKFNLISIVQNPS